MDDYYFDIDEYVSEVEQYPPYDPPEDNPLTYDQKYEMDCYTSTGLTPDEKPVRLIPYPKRKEPDATHTM